MSPELIAVVTEIILTGLTFMVLKVERSLERIEQRLSEVRIVMSDASDSMADALVAIIKVEWSVATYGDVVKEFNQQAHELALPYRLALIDDDGKVIVENGDL